MKKILGLFCICLVLISCNNADKQKSEEKDITNEEPQAVGQNNYAIIWSTPNAELIKEYSEAIATEFTELRINKIIENAYFDKDSNQENHGSFPNIAFFLKAKSKADAKSVLDDLTIVKQGIASYKIYPVGILWLDRNSRSEENSLNKKSYVTVWERKSQTPGSELISEQSDKIIELWNEGVIENVYFDTEGTQYANEATDFVFFVNANSTEEVIQLCDSLPFFRNKIATYQMFEVGVFWFGKFQD